MNETQDLDTILDQADKCIQLTKNLLCSSEYISNGRWKAELKSMFKAKTLLVFTMVLEPDKEKRITSIILEIAGLMRQIESLLKDNADDLHT